MALTRKDLEDLYKAGGEYDLSPHGDGSAMVYVRKLGPTQQSTAVRKANAARLAAQLRMEDEEDLYNVQIRRDIEELTRDQKIDAIAMSEVGEERQKAEQEISEEEGWLKDGKLQSLVDAWEGGLMADYIQGEGERSEESERVFKEMQRFTEAVNGKIQDRLDKVRAEVRQMSDEALDRKMIQSQVEYDASMEWMRAFRAYQILYGIHDLERTPMFASIEEVESMPAEVFAKMVDAVLQLAVPTIEVKS